MVSLLPDWAQMDLGMRFSVHLHLSEKECSEIEEDGSQSGSAFVYARVRSIEERIEVSGKRAQERRSPQRCERPYVVVDRAEAELAWWGWLVG